MNAQQALGVARQKIDQLQKLADTQAALIGVKNDEIARLTAELARCQATDYADDLQNDSEAGAIAGTLEEVLNDTSRNRL
jgi:hypothetical protein